MNKQVKVDGMTCNGCAKTVKSAFEEVEGIRSVEINLDNQTASVDTDTELNIDNLNHSLVDTNYSATAITNA